MKFALYKAYETHVQRRNTFRYLAEFEKSQWLNYDLLDKARFASLKLLLKEAYENVPYYNRIWTGMGIHYNDINSYQDFSKLPLLTKDIIRENHEDMIHRRHKASGDMIKKATGGSTGTPLEFYLSRESNERRVAVMHRGYAASGYTPGSKALFLWAMAAKPKIKTMLKDRLYHWLHNRKLVNIFDIGNKGMQYYIDQIRELKPDAIVSYTTPIYTLSKYIVDNGVSVPPVKTIITAAENLFPHQREMIHKAFQADVRNSYGSREFMLIAFECEQGTLHMNIDNLYTEVLDGALAPVSGVAGDIVVTDLYNHAMPFIRYVNGDIGVMEKKHCACGRGLDEQFTELQGRRADIIYTQKREPLTGLFFVYVFLYHKNVLEYQVIQNSYDSLDIKVVMQKDSLLDEAKVITDIKNAMGQNVDIRLHYVEKIERNKTGKLRVTVSNLQ